jgi:hypothetical protein
MEVRVDAKDTPFLGGCGNGAGGIASEEAIAMASDEAVAEFAEAMGYQAEGHAEGGPGAVEEAEGFADGVGAAVDALRRSEGCGDEHNTFGGRLLCEMERGQEFLRERGLLGDEAEALDVVVAEEEVDDAVTQGADAVVENDRVGFDLSALKLGHRGCLRLLYWIDAAHINPFPPTTTSC